MLSLLCYFPSLRVLQQQQLAFILSGSVGGNSPIQRVNVQAFVLEFFLLFLADYVESCSHSNPLSMRYKNIQNVWRTHFLVKFLQWQYVCVLHFALNSNLLVSVHIYLQVAK